MRLILLLVLCCLAWECYTSPVQRGEQRAEVAAESKDKVDGRQAGGAAAPATADDDDDDDDDDDLEDAILDDDDDDEEDEAPAAQAAGPVAAATGDADDDDDDDDDYLERIFDDILDDDDDDDDDVSPSTGVQPAQPAAASVVATLVSEAPVATVIADTDAAAGLSVDYPSEGEQTVFYDEENGGIDTKVDVQALTKPQEQIVSNVGQKVSAAQPPSNAISNASDDDDDDDDDDEIEGALDDDDDDDDDDEEDDLIGDDVIEAKRARSLEKQNNIPEVLTQKYNRFVDGIFGRINKILMESYDPVRVRLSVRGKQTKTKSAISKSNASPKRKISNKAKRRPKAEIKSSLNENKSENQVIDEEVHAPNSIPVGIPEKFVTAPEQQSQAAEQRTTKQKQKKPTSAAAAADAAKPAKKNAPKGADEKNRWAQGTLYGLASLTRVGNVKVTPEGNNSTIKSKFTLGPLTLKVEKSFKRGNIRNVKSATARTNEMIGRINLRVVDGAATLVSIKVQQPKQVQVESLDNHDRTREFVWKRTPHIAHLVSDKLRAAARSLLRPARSQIVVRQ